ncbi:MAG: ComEC/Rec2 family competence protein, partial [bacterium]|nr:ComEC/Rec2 family competence protein [bacterium]
LVTVRPLPNPPHHLGRDIMLVGFLGLTLLFGAWRYKSVLPYENANFVGKYFGQEIELEGVVVREPDMRSDKINLTVKPVSLSSTSPGLAATLPTPGEGGIEGNILLNLGRYPEYKYGDRLKIKGKLAEPFESEEFSYKDYLSRFDTYAVMRFPKIEKLGENQGSPIKAALLSVKYKFQEVLSQSLPEPHSALMMGLILGVKRALPEDFRDALIAVGVSHIIVISGYNISIITRNLLKTRWVLGRRVAFGLSLLFVLAFVIMTCADASVIRAATMGLLLVLAMNIGRLYSALPALVFAGTLMIAQNPKILSFDIGFQLSFLATMGLIFLAPIFEKWFAKIPNILWFRDNLTSSFSAIIFTLPLLIYYFDRVSLVALPANIFILWVVPAAMFFGFVTGLAGIVYLPIAKLIGGITWVILEYVVRVVEFFARLPLASTDAQINISFVIIYYLLLIFGLVFYRRKKKFYYQLEYVEHKL